MPENVERESAPLKSIEELAEEQGVKPFNVEEVREKIAAIFADEPFDPKGEFDDWLCSIRESPEASRLLAEIALLTVGDSILASMFWKVALLDLDDRDARTFIENARVTLLGEAKGLVKRYREINNI